MKPKSQIPSTKNQRTSKHEVAIAGTHAFQMLILGFEFGASLDVGALSLELLK